jgi:deoxyadenosine/deoxycytidine kinase
MAASIAKDDVRQSAPRIVEIVGPAGVGKTTISRILNRNGEHFQLGHFPDVRKKADAPFFFYYGLGLVPLLLRLYQGQSKWLNRQEFAWLTILSGWSHRLRMEKSKSDKVIVLDQGPVYLLAETNELGPECLKSPRAEKFWKSIYHCWATTLDMVIWLDTDNSLLLERIQTRTKGHVVKNESTQTVFRFLESYRTAYAHIFCMLKANTRGPRIINFDTGQEQPDEIADRLLVECGLKWSK